MNADLSSLALRLERGEDIDRAVIVQKLRAADRLLVEMRHLFDNMRPDGKTIIDFLNVWLDQERRINRASQARIAELEAALRPFAADANKWADTVPGDYRSLCTEPGLPCALPGSETAFTVGDIRRARAALTQEKNRD